MDINGIALMILVIAAGSHVIADEFKCKPRPGCNFAKCDPARTISFGILNDREYSIICEGNRAAQQEDSVSRLEYNQLQNALRRMQAELATVKFDIKFLKLQRPQQGGENTLPLTSTTIVPSTTVTLSTTSVSPTPQLVGRPQDNPLIPPKPCRLRIDDTCLYLIQVKRQGYDHVEAESECKNQGVDLAEITSKEMYDILVKTLRLESGSWTYFIWTGMFYSLNRNAITRPKNAYMKWATGYPDSNSINAMHVAIRVSSDPKDTNQGMINSGWHVKYGSVLCQWIDE